MNKIPHSPASAPTPPTLILPHPAPAVPAEQRKSIKVCTVSAQSSATKEVRRAPAEVRPFWGPDSTGETLLGSRAAAQAQPSFWQSGSSDRAHKERQEPWGQLSAGRAALERPWLEGWGLSLARACMEGAGSGHRQSLGWGWGCWMEGERGEKYEAGPGDLSSQRHAHLLPGPYTPVHEAIFAHTGTLMKRLDFM